MHCKPEKKPEDPKDILNPDGDAFGCRCHAEPTLANSGEGTQVAALFVIPAVIEGVVIIGNIAIRVEQARRAAVVIGAAGAVVETLPDAENPQRIDDEITIIVTPVEQNPDGENEDEGEEEDTEGAEGSEGETPEPPDPDDGDDKDKKKPKLRKQYEEDVRDLEKIEEKLRKEGKSDEEIAREMQKQRREIGKKYKDLTEPDELKE